MNVVRRPHWLPDPEAGESSFVGSLLRQETVGGAIALVAAVVAVVWANFDYASYQDLRHLVLGPLDVEHWAADGALTLFFFVAGLELKRELRGRLAAPARRRGGAGRGRGLRCRGAGTDLPRRQPGRRRRRPRRLGDPGATDIAFALAVLAVVGSALPTPLRAFLLTLAVVDDLLVIVIIAVFYTDQLYLRAGSAARWSLLAAYAVLQRRRVSSAAGLRPARGRPPGGACTRAASTPPIAGVALGLLTRVVPDPDEARSPAERLEHRLVAVERRRRGAVLRAAQRGRGVQRRRRAGARPGGARRRARAGGRQAGRGAGRGVAGHPVHPRRARRRASAGATSSAWPCWPVSGSRSRCWSPTCRSPDARPEEAKTAVLVGVAGRRPAGGAGPRSPQPRAPEG